MTTYNPCTTTYLKQFDPADYPLVVNELKCLSQEFLSIPGVHKADMLISYLRHHSIKTIWIKSDPEAAKLVISNRLQTDNIERLFAMCLPCPGFLKEFEQYFRSRFRSENTNEASL